VGELIARMVAEREPVVSIEPFLLGRFG
jgi:hypothetical protein